MPTVSIKLKKPLRTETLHIIIPDLCAKNHWDIESVYEDKYFYSEKEGIIYKPEFKCFEINNQEGILSMFNDIIEVDFYNSEGNVYVRVWWSLEDTPKFAEKFLKKLFNHLIDIRGR